MVEELTSKPRVPRRIKWLLFVSLALNLVVAGLVIGAVAGGGPRGAKNYSERSWGTPFTRALEREDKRAIGRDIRRGFSEMGEGQHPRALRREAHTEALMLLRAETFDSDAFVNAMSKQADVVRLLSTSGAKALARHLQTFSQAERLAYADRVEDAMTRRRGAKK